MVTMESLQETTIALSSTINDPLRPSLPSKWGPKCTPRDMSKFNFERPPPHRVIRSTSCDFAACTLCIDEIYSGIAQFPCDSTAFLYNDKCRVILKACIRLRQKASRSLACMPCSFNTELNLARESILCCRCSAQCHIQLPASAAQV